jgi:alpha-tubulin suppressor-like RCC1 family protein
MLPNRLISTRLALKSALKILALGLAHLAIASCDSDSTGPGNAVATIEIAPGEVAFTTIGGSEQLTASVLDNKGGTIAGVKVAWQSSNATVASVDSLGLVLAVAAGTAKISASAGGKSGTVEVTVAPAASRLVFKNEPSEVVAGDPLDPAVRVEIQDANGHPVTGSAAEITLALVGGPEDAALLGTTTVSPEGGVATFEGLNIERAGSGYRLQASAADIAKVESGAFAVLPAEAAQLVFIAAPTAAKGQVPFAPALEIEARDRFGNRTPDWTGEITLALEENPGQAELVGTQTMNAAGGVARFGDISVTNPGKGYTLRAEASGLSTAESAPFDVRLTFATLSAGISHTCGLTPEGKAYCWGVNGRGQLGDGSTKIRHTPGAVSDGRVFTALNTGSEHTCGLTPEGKAYCWGINENGRLGNGSTTNSLTPAAVSGNALFNSLSAGYTHTCGFAETGYIPGLSYCWGANSNGQLGNGRTSDRDIPDMIAGNLISLSAGGWHTCGLTREGKAYCWGWNGYGGIGDGSTTDRLEAVAVSGNHTFTSMSAGGEHTCGLTPEGKTYCWGRNNYGQLGDGSTTNRLIPVAVSGDRTFTSLSAGGSHTCGLTPEGKAYCWGRNFFGQLGDGSITQHQTPAAVSGNLTFTSLSAGGSHTCGVTSVGESFCWGLNVYGLLGDGTSTDSPIPIPVFGTER